MAETNVDPSKSIHKADHKAEPAEAFQFQLTTDEIREKMFEYIKELTTDEINAYLSKSIHKADYKAKPMAETNVDPSKSIHKADHKAEPAEAFQFQLTTDEIREKMFEYIKKIRHNPYEKFEKTNWIYGVYDRKSGLFLTYFCEVLGYSKCYIVLSDAGEVFDVTYDVRPDDPLKLRENRYRSLIREGMVCYQNIEAEKYYENHYPEEQKKTLNDIACAMRDKLRPSAEIRSFEDAERFFAQNEFDYHSILSRYNKATIEQFNRFMSEKKMQDICGREFRSALSKIISYGNNPGPEKNERMSKEFFKARNLVYESGEDICEDLVLQAIRTACPGDEYLSHYVDDFIYRYIQFFFEVHPDRIQSLRPILDFINEHKNEIYNHLEYYRKELDRLIYHREEGFQVICTTNEIREKMFNYLKPDYQGWHPFNILNCNWITGVYDRERDIFLTLLLFVSSSLSEDGVNYWQYIVISDQNNIFIVEDNEGKGCVFTIPERYEHLTDTVKEGIKLYRWGHYLYERSMGAEALKQVKEDWERQKPLLS